MEMEPRPPAVAKKLWNALPIIFYKLKKGISNRKLILDLNLIFNRSKLAGKAISDLMLHHYSSFTCRSNDSLSFISPREYEFSCSNSPAFQFQFHPFHHSKRKNHHHYQYDDVSTVSAVQKVLELLNNERVDASPLSLPGFGKSPLVRQLRITDSPFPLKETEGDKDSHVDVAAEEFIKKFYKELKLQKRKAAIESPHRNAWDR